MTGHESKSVYRSSPLTFMERTPLGEGRSSYFDVIGDDEAISALLSRLAEFYGPEDLVNIAENLVGYRQVSDRYVLDVIYVAKEDSYTRDRLLRLSERLSQGLISSDVFYDEVRRGNNLFNLDLPVIINHEGYSCYLDEEERRILPEIDQEFPDDLVRILGLPDDTELNLFTYYVIRHRMDLATSKHESGPYYLIYGYLDEEDNFVEMASKLPKTHRVFQTDTAS